MGWPLWSLPSVPLVGSSEASAPSPLKYLGVVGSRSTPYSTSATSTVDPRLAVEIHRPPRGLPKLADSQLWVRKYLFFYDPLSHLSSIHCLSSLIRMGLLKHKMCLCVLTMSSTSIERTGITPQSNLALAIHSRPLGTLLKLAPSPFSFCKVLFANNLITVYFITLHFIMEFMYNYYSALVSLPTPSTITNPQPSSCSSRVHS